MKYNFYKLTKQTTNKNKIIQIKLIIEIIKINRQQITEWTKIQVIEILKIKIIMDGKCKINLYLRLNQKSNRKFHTIPFPIRKIKIQARFKTITHNKCKIVYSISNTQSITCPTTNSLLSGKISNIKQTIRVARSLTTNDQTILRPINKTTGGGLTILTISKPGSKIDEGLISLRKINGGKPLTTQLKTNFDSKIIQRTTTINRKITLSR